MNITKEWSTLELMEFLNSYNRVYKQNKDKALKFQKLYVFAFAELHNRSQLLAMTY